MESEAFESLLRKVQNLSPENKLAFGMHLTKRMIPNYRNFSRIESWGDTNVLTSCIEIVRAFLVDGIEFPIEVLREKLLEIAPDCDDFNSAGASYALNACAACDDLLQFAKTKALNDFERIIDLSFETVRIFSLDSGAATEMTQDEQNPILSNEIRVLSLDIDSLIVENEFHQFLYQNFDISNIGLG